MSLCCREIGRKIVSHSLTSPKLGKVADAVGKVFSTVSFGHYKVRLTRTAFQLSQLIKPGDILKIQSGQIFKEDTSILTNEKLFGGINIDRIEVTDKMCTPEGTASYLRWDAIGNTPSLMASLFPLLGSIFWAKFFVMDYLNFYHPALNGFRIAISLILASPSFIPYYRIMALFKPRGISDTTIRLSDAENYTVKECHYHDSQPLSSGAFMACSIPKWIFINDSAFRLIPRDIKSIHETAHLLGASEFGAYKIQDKKVLKLIFHGNQTSRNIIEWARLLRSLMDASILNCLKSNIAVLTHGKEYYRDDSFLQLINNKQKLEELIKRFEKGETKLDNYPAAIAYKIHGDIEKALIYYHKSINEAKNEENYLALQVLYLAIGITMQEIGNVQGAKTAFESVLEMASRKGTDPDFSAVAQAKLDEIKESCD